MSQPPLKRSIFDSADFVPERFWKQKEASHFSNIPLTREGVFYYRTRKVFQDQTSCVLSLRGSFFIFQKKNEKTVEYIDFEEFMYQFEVIKPSDKRYSSKYKFGFALSSSGKSVEFYCKDQTQFQIWMDEFRQYCVIWDGLGLYKLGEILGTGGYGKVYLAEDNVTKIKWAAKFIRINRAKNVKRQIVMLRNEIRILRKLDHPNIVKLHEVHELNDEVCLIMEYLDGKRLFDHVLDNKQLFEQETALLMKQLLLSLHCLQMKDVIHRDIKPENLVMTKNKEGRRVMKLIDFGLGTSHKNRDIIKKCGTAGYVAPEVLNHGTYDFSVDVYSAGIVMMVCLTGKPAFHTSRNKDYKALLEKNAKGVLNTKGKKWFSLSKEARDLIQNLTDIDPAARMTIEEALNHEWFAKTLSPEELADLRTHDLTSKNKIPQEERISIIPSSVRKASHQQIGSISVFDSAYSNFSQSFINSFNQIEKGSMPTLNSFYKGGSYESSFIEGTSSNVSSPLLAKGWRTNPHKLSATENVLPLPSKKPNSKAATPTETRRRSVSLNIAIVTELGGSPHGPGTNYKIQISAIDSPREREMMSISSDDSTCGTKYMSLPKNNFSVRKNVSNGGETPSPSIGSKLPMVFNFASPTPFSKEVSEESQTSSIFE